MNDVFLEEVVDAGEEMAEWEYGGEKALVVQPQDERPTLQMFIHGFELIIENELIPIADRAQEIVGYIRNAVTIMDENMIMLGYLLYHVRERRFWHYIPGSHTSFEQWCMLGSEGLDPTTVSTAIRKYLNWSDCLDFNVPQDIMFNQPLSVVKGEMIQRTIAEHRRDVKELTRLIKDPVERKAKIEEFTERRREELTQVWQDPEEVLIAKKREEDGAPRQENLYITDAQWDDEQRLFTFTGSLSIDDSDMLLGDLVAKLHNATKSKFFIQVKRKGEEDWKSLLDMTKAMNQEMRNSIDQEEIYEEWVEDEDEEAME